MLVPNPTHPRHCRGISIIEVIVLLVVLLFIVGILLPAPGCRVPAAVMQNSTQLRGIQQAMVLYAQGNGGFYPGMDVAGQVIYPTVQQRFRAMLEDNYFTGEYAISPLEPKRGKVAWSRGVVSTRHYSYALLQIAQPADRLVEWRETGNAQAAVASDRAIENGDGAFIALQSWAPLGQTAWRGSVAWNDNHVTREADHEIATTYDDRKHNQQGVEANPRDHLFEPEGGADAWMVHDGAWGR